MLIRRGVTLLEIVVTALILSVIGLVVYQNEAAASKVGSDVARIDQAARVLAELADALGRITGTGGVTSFNQFIGQANSTGTSNAGKLSFLTRPITVADLNACMYPYSQSEANRWTTPFYYRIVPGSGFLIAPGFFAQDSLIRFNAVGVPTTVANRPAANDARTFGTLAIVIPNVSRSDALALANRVEGDQSGVAGAVRYDPNIDPTTVYYHFTIRGC